MLGLFIPSVIRKFCGLFLIISYCYIDINKKYDGYVSIACGFAMDKYMTYVCIRFAYITLAIISLINCLS